MEGDERMDGQVFVFILQLFFIGAWFSPLIVVYWIWKYWAEEKRKNNSGGKRMMEPIGRLRPNES